MTDSGTDQAPVTCRRRKAAKVCKVVYPIEDFELIGMNKNLSISSLIRLLNLFHAHAAEVGDFLPFANLGIDERREFIGHHHGRFRTLCQEAVVESGLA